VVGDFNSVQIQVVGGRVGGGGPFNTELSVVGERSNVERGSRNGGQWRAVTVERVTFPRNCPGTSTVVLCAVRHAVSTPCGVSDWLMEAVSNNR
jgi:hypothetical protein